MYANVCTQVITWVNTSHAPWIKAEADKETNRGHTTPYPDGVDCSGNFNSLKFTLRSLKKFGLMAHVRKVHIVHSDLHPPPAYLMREHARLQRESDATCRALAGATVSLD